MSEIMTAIEAVGKSFEELKKTNQQMLEEERKGNQARAMELKNALDKISDDLSAGVKAKEIAEKRLSTLQDRLEIVEAMNDRPRATIQDKIRSEHKDLFFRWVRSRGTDDGAVHAYKELVQKAREVKDVSIGTDSAGGFALPEEISRSIDNLVLKLSAIAGEVKNVQVGSSDYKEFELTKLKGTLVDLNAFYPLLSGHKDVLEWQLEIRKHNDDPFDLDELYLHISPAEGISRRYLEKELQDLLQREVEVAPTGIVFHSLPRLLDRLGLDTKGRERRFIDRRADASGGKAEPEEEPSPQESLDLEEEALPQGYEESYGDDDLPDED